MNRQFHQARRTIDIDAIEMSPRSAANRTGTVDQGVCTVNQATEVVGILKITLDPPYINAGRSFAD